MSDDDDVAARQRQHERARRERLAATDFLRELRAWTWWGTVTFRWQTQRDRARYELRAWLRRIAVDVDDHVSVAWVIEPTRLGADHAHVLLAIPATRSLRRERAEDLWKSGNARGGYIHMVRYAPGRRYGDPQFGAAGYLAAKTDWNVTVACPRHPPCRRKRGCVQLRGPWF
ncbi:MAG TPA: hypothetical protein VGH28_02110 [Polyangiaceae bacterium]|jgi:hypothetical protein